MAKPEFNMENLQKCVCNECPVQAKSQCAQKGFKMMPQTMKKNENIILTLKDIVKNKSRTLIYSY